MKFQKQISRSFTKFHKVSNFAKNFVKNFAKCNPYLKFQNAQKALEISREISWNFAINFTWNFVKFQQKFHLKFPFASEGAGACMFFFSENGACVAIPERVQQPRSVCSNPGACAASWERVQQVGSVCSKVRAVRSIGLKKI